MILFGDLIWRRAADWSVDATAPRGYLAGEQDPAGDAGDGLVTSGGTVAARHVLVFVQVGSMLGSIVASEFSNAAGEWRVNDLPSLDRYTVMAIDYTDTYQPVTRRSKQPYTP